MTEVTVLGGSYHLKQLTIRDDCRRISLPVRSKPVAYWSPENLRSSSISVEDYRVETMVLHRDIRPRYYLVWEELSLDAAFELFLNTFYGPGF